MSERFVAAQADVVWRANTGEVEADVDRLRRQFRTSTQSMSDDTLKLAVAQDRLDKALLRHGPSSAAAKRAELDLRRAMDQTAGSSRRLDGELDRNTRSLERMGRGAIAGSGALRSLRGSVAFASSAFLGGAGLVYGIRSVIAAASESELVLGQTEKAVESAGLAWGEYADQVERAIREQSRFGFDDEDLLKSFSVFVRSTNDVNKALELNALAIEVARGRHISLEAAQQIVLKASIGMAGQLRRLGLDVEKNATSMQLLEFLTTKYAGSAEKAADTATGAQDRWSVAVENFQEALGEGALPALVDAIDAATKWIDTASDSGEMQRRVNDAVEKGETVVRALGASFDFLDSTIVGPLKKLGLLEEAITAALLLGLAGKVRKSAASFGLISAASAATTAKVTRDAALAGRALDMAYRPRNFTVTGGGVPSGVPTGRGRGLATGGNIILLLTALLGPEAVAKMQKEQSEGGQGIGRFFPDFDLWPGGPSIRDLIGGNEPERDPVTGAPRLRSPDAADAAAAAAASRAGRSGTGRSARTLADIRLDQARAEARGDTAGEERALREERDFLQRQIRVLERRKTLTAEQKEKLRGLYGDIARVQGELDGIAADRERTIDDARKAAAEKRETERDRRRGVEQREYERAAERSEEHAKLLAQQQVGRHGFNRQGLRRASLANVDKTLEALQGKEGTGLAAKKRAADQGLTMDDFRRQSFDFLGSLHGVMSQYGSNMRTGNDPGWALHSQGEAQLAKLEKVVGGVRTLTQRVAHPEARYLGSVAEAMMDGVGVG